jgi:hypothetical protein
MRRSNEPCRAAEPVVLEESRERAVVQEASRERAVVQEESREPAVVLEESREPEEVEMAVLSRWVRAVAQARAYGVHA